MKEIKGRDVNIFVKITQILQIFIVCGGSIQFGHDSQRLLNVLNRHIIKSKNES